jgi:hypothetical protein
MPNQRSDHRAERGILPIIRDIRQRWRLRVMLTGAAVVLAVGLATFVFFSWGLELLKFSPAAVVASRVIAWGTILGLIFYFLVRPLRRQLTDEQVALYLEEHEPTMEAQILGAVAAERAAQASRSGKAPELVSSAFIQRMIQQAVDRAKKVDFGRRIEQRPLYRSTGVLGTLSVASIIVLMLAPPGVRSGMSALLLPVKDAVEASPYAIEVEPGDVTIPRGSDQSISAALRGFSSEEVTLWIEGAEGPPQRFSMFQMDADAGFEMLLLNLQEETTYYVESASIRSRSYTIKVEDLPYVESMQHEYTFPTYTHLEPRLIEAGRDIAALRGTRVAMTLHPTMETAGGQIVLENGTTIPLTLQDSTLTATIEVTERGTYKVELQAPDGRLVTASPTYTIDVLTDQTPSVRFTKPGRDSNASPVEEVFLEARADDDYGINQLFVVYSVNAQAEDTVWLYRGEGGAVPEFTAGHTLFLEELTLTPGDMITYYAKARDNDQAAGGKEVTSDMYFLTIRPFGRDYRQGEGGGGGGGGGGGSGVP